MISSVKEFSLKVTHFCCTPCRPIGSRVRTVHACNHSGKTAWAGAGADTLNSECVGKTGMDSFSTSKWKRDEGDLLGGFIPVNYRLFTHFLTQYYSCAGVALVNSFRVAITNAEMDANILSETSCLHVVPSAKQHQLQHFMFCWPCISICVCVMKPTLCTIYLQYIYIYM
jgi:hypothetical protein